MIRGLKYLMAQVKLKVYKPLIKVWRLYSALIFFRNLSVTKQTQVIAKLSPLSDLVYDQRLKIPHGTS